MTGAGERPVTDLPVMVTVLPVEEPESSRVRSAVELPRTARAPLRPEVVPLVAGAAEPAVMVEWPVPEARTVEAAGAVERTPTVEEPEPRVKERVRG